VNPEAADRSRMLRIEGIERSSLEDPDGLAEMAREAEAFLAAHRWCQSIRQGYLDRGWAGILAVFLFDIEPAPAADASVWVIVGDLPPAYLDLVTCPNGAAAVEGYVGAMQEWVDCVLARQSLEGLIPVYRRGSLVEVPPTLEFARALGDRLAVIRDVILSQLGDELGA
jgi:hypothetical protein